MENCIPTASKSNKGGFFGFFGFFGPKLRKFVTGDPYSRIISSCALGQDTVQGRGAASKFNSTQIIKTRLN